MNLPDDPHDEDRTPWEEMLSSMLGPDVAAEAIRAMRAQGVDPAALADQADLPTDPAQLHAVMAQVQRLLAAGGDGPVNWTLAQDLARQTAVHEGDPTISAARAEATRQALRVADLWLDAATDLTPAAATPQVWSRADWVARTLPTWQRLAEPVAQRVTEALVQATASQSEHLPPEVRQLFGSGTAGHMMRQMGGAVYGMQLGQAVGTLATEAFGSTDAGLPLLEEAGTALVPANVEEFADGLDATEDDVRQFLAVREAAHARLFAGVPWLRAHLLGIVEAYAREITIDLSAMEEAVRDLDPANPDKLRESLSSGVFGLEQTESQKAALVRLETALALVEGWVEEVTAQAVAPHLPHAVPLREMLRRRRATGGPAEQVFATLVGLELRPRRIREAAALWSSLQAQRGPEARDALWAHPDLMPTPEELDDPTGFVAGRDAASAADEDVDAQLAALLDGTLPHADEDGDGRDAEGPQHDDGPEHDDGPDDAPRGPAAH